MTLNYVKKNISKKVQFSEKNMFKKKSPCIIRYQYIIFFYYSYSLCTWLAQGK